MEYDIYYYITARRKHEVVTSNVCLCVYVCVYQCLFWYKHTLFYSDVEAQDAKPRRNIVATNYVKNLIQLDLSICR